MVNTRRNKAAQQPDPPPPSESSNDQLEEVEPEQQPTTEQTVEGELNPGEPAARSGPSKPKRPAKNKAPAKKPAAKPAAPGQAAEPEPAVDADDISGDKEEGDDDGDKEDEEDDQVKDITAECYPVASLSSGARQLEPARTLQFSTGETLQVLKFRIYHVFSIEPKDRIEKLAYRFNGKVFSDLSTPEAFEQMLEAVKAKKHTIQIKFVIKGSQAEPTAEPSKKKRKSKDRDESEPADDADEDEDEEPVGPSKKTKPKSKEKKSKKGTSTAQKAMNKLEELYEPIKAQIDERHPLGGCGDPLHANLQCVIIKNQHVTLNDTLKDVWASQIHAGMPHVTLDHAPSALLRDAGPRHSGSAPFGSAGSTSQQPINVTVNIPPAVSSPEVSRASVAPRTPVKGTSNKPDILSSPPTKHTLDDWLARARLQPSLEAKLREQNFDPSTNLSQITDTDFKEMGINPFEKAAIRRHYYNFKHGFP